MRTNDPLRQNYSLFRRKCFECDIPKKDLNDTGNIDSSNPMDDDSMDDDWRDFDVGECWIIQNKYDLLRMKIMTC